MAFVRKRQSRSGGPSTTLVESYRDEAGRPRQRVLANLFGEEDTLAALAKLAAHRVKLREEKSELKPQIKDANEFYAVITTRTLEGVRFSQQQRKEIDSLLRQRNQVLKRADKVDRDLAKIQKHGAVIRKHCKASQDEIQKAIRKYKKEMAKAENYELGMDFILGGEKAKLRRYRI